MINIEIFDWPELSSVTLIDASYVDANGNLLIRNYYEIISIEEYMKNNQNE